MDKSAVAGLSVFVVQLPPDIRTTSNPIIRTEDLLRVITVYLNRIAKAEPEHHVHDDFVIFTEQILADQRLRTVLRRMVSCADIAHRYSFFDPQKGTNQFSPQDACESYRRGSFPNMMSATVMFVLRRMIRQARSGQHGRAMSFDLAPTAVTMRSHAV